MVRSLLFYFTITIPSQTPKSPVETTNTAINTGFVTLLSDTTPPCSILNFLPSQSDKDTTSTASRYLSVGSTPPSSTPLISPNTFNGVSSSRRPLVVQGSSGKVPSPAATGRYQSNSPFTPSVSAKSNDPGSAPPRSSSSNLKKSSTLTVNYSTPL